VIAGGIGAELVADFAVAFSCLRGHGVCFHVVRFCRVVVGCGLESVVSREFTGAEAPVKRPSLLV
jgi:hypothetical protein